MENGYSQELAFSLIFHAGNARSAAFEAIALAKEGKYELIDEKIKEINNELSEAHQIQTDLLVRISQGEQLMADVLMVHAQDHLADAILIKEIAKSLISMEKEIHDLKAQLENK